MRAQETGCRTVFIFNLKCQEEKTTWLRIYPVQRRKVDLTWCSCAFVFSWPAIMLLLLLIHTFGVLSS